MLAVPLLEPRLVVVQIDVRGRAVLQKVDDALGLRREVRERRRGGVGREREAVAGKQCAQRSGADPGGGVAEEGAARQMKAVGFERVH